MSKLSHLTPEQRAEHVQAQRRAQQLRHQARRTPEQREARCAYLREWHQKRRAGELVPRVLKTREEKLATRAEGERRRNASLTPEQRREKRARRYGIERASRMKPIREPKVAKAKAPKVLRVAQPKLPKPKPHGLKDCAKSNLSPAPFRLPTTEGLSHAQLKAMGVRVDVLPGARYIPPRVQPMGDGWGGTRAAA